MHTMVGAENRLETQKDRAALVLSCEADTTDVYVIWRQYLGTYDLDVTWRIGSGQDVTETWSLSTDSEAIFAPEPVQLIKRMLASDLFLIKASPFGSSPVTLEFNTAGLATEALVLEEACGW
jgi:type VI secretion system protein VasI